MADQTKNYFFDDEEKLRRYKNRLSWARKAQQQFRDNAEIYLSYYRNKNRVFTKGGQRVIVPRAIKNVDAMFAALTAFDVWPVVVPHGLTTIDMAMVQQQLLRFEWDQEEVLATSEGAIKEALICGIGYVKVGYEYEEEEGEAVTDEEVQREYIRLEIEAQRTGQQYDPKELLKQARQPEKEVIKDNVIVEHIPYDEVYFDPEAKKWKDIRWIIQRYEFPLEDVMNDESFPTANKQDLKRDTQINERWRSEDAPKEPDADEERVVLFELHDFETGTNCWFSEGHDKLLKESPNPFALRKRTDQRNPYVPYITRTDVNNVIGISDVQVMKPAIDEENVLRSSLATYVERMKPKVLADEGVFTEQGKRAVRSQEWGEVVEIRNDGVSMGKVRPMEMPHLPQEAFIQDSKAASDADSSIGLNEVLQGQLPQGRKTATGMNIMAQASTVRQSEKRNHLERFYKSIADRMLYLMKLFYEQDRIVRIAEDYGDVAWQFNSDDIVFESGVGVELEQKEVLDTDAKREKMLALWNLAGADPEVDKTELKRYVLRGIGVPEEIIRKLIKTPEQMQVEQQSNMQMQANQVGAQQGLQTPPENIPGPLPGSELLQLANEGQRPNPT